MVVEWLKKAEEMMALILRVMMEDYGKAMMLQRPAEMIVQNARAPIAFCCRYVPGLRFAVGTCESYRAKMRCRLCQSLRGNVDLVHVCNLHSLSSPSLTEDLQAVLEERSGYGCLVWSVVRRVVNDFHYVWRQRPMLPICSTRALTAARCY